MLREQNTGLKSRRLGFVFCFFPVTLIESFTFFVSLACLLK